MATKHRETTRGPRYDVQWRLPDHSKRKKTFQGAQPHENNDTDDPEMFRAEQSW